MDEGDSSKSFTDGGNNSCLLEEGEWIPEHDCGTTDSSGNILDEGASWDEENWRAQYGQVIKSVEETAPAMPVLDLWNWKTVSGVKKNGKRQVIRLVGRVVRQSVKLHPSMPSSASLLKTAPICETLFDLVRVRSDWDFPELSINEVSKPGGICQSKATDKVLKEKFSTLQDDVSASRKHNGHAYRDRAAERRALHGGVGIGPGQKRFCDDVDQPPSTSYSAEESAAEAWNMSFGADSYARKIMKTMGWEEGKALGKTQTGLMEPLQAVGNKGNAGLGWPYGRT
ncbi:G-patch domain [Dillenia turbinata]|uniref:G-patch domain n=1 Tax=Dillenia turbinata TaxID=194707 RepID=A0AAN8Z153_9MAGN